MTFLGSSTAAGRSPAALRSRTSMTGTTLPLTEVNTGSGLLMIDLKYGRDPGVDGVSNTVLPVGVVPLVVRPSSSRRSSAAPQEARTAPLVQVPSSRDRVATPARKSVV